MTDTTDLHPLLRSPLVAGRPAVPDDQRKHNGRERRAASFILITELVRGTAAAGADELTGYPRSGQTNTLFLERRIDAFPQKL